jgi:hypothetical protein
MGADGGNCGRVSVRALPSLERFQGLDGKDAEQVVGQARGLVA